MPGSQYQGCESNYRDGDCTTRLLSQMDCFNCYVSVSHFDDIMCTPIDQEMDAGTLLLQNTTKMMSYGLNA